MKIEKGRISNLQLFYLMVAFMQSMALTVGFSFSITQQCTWLVVIAAYVITLLITLVYLGIAKRYPEKNLVQINDAVFGAYLGKLISIIYIWSLFQMVVHYIFFFNSFWISYILPETPRAAFGILFGIICAMAIRSGLEVITRCSYLITVVIWATTIVLVVLLIESMDLSFLLPVFQSSPKEVMHSTHILLSIPFGDIVGFLMIFPYTADKTNLKKPVLLAISVSAVHLLIVVVRDILVLGPTVGNVVSASFMAARQIDVANILTRMDILIAMSLLFSIFMKVAVLSYIVTLGTAQLLSMRSYKHLAIPIMLIAVSTGVALYPNSMERVNAAIYKWPLNATVYEFLLPILTIIIIGIKSLAGRKKETGTQ